MEGITFIVAVLCSILVLVLRPAFALVTYIAALVWYPYYLTMRIGTLDISAARVVIAVLLLRCLVDEQIRKKFVWTRLDTCVTLSMVVYVGIHCLTRPLLLALENRGGFLVDTWFAYMAVRLIVTDRATLISFVKGTSIVLTALAILGVAESITHTQPFLQLKLFRSWRTPVENIAVHARWGLARAVGPFGHSIMFGSCFVTFLPLFWALRHQRDYWGKLAYPLSVIAVLGALSSMSSGPWVMLIVMIFCLVMERYKRWVKHLFMTLAILCILAEVASNRPLHRVVIPYMNPAGGAGLHRARVIDLAIEHFDEWWLAGYGGRDPGWGSWLSADYTDVTNQFIRAGVDYGILGIVALCAVLIQAFRSLSCASKETMETGLKSLYWSLGSVLISLIVIWMGVSFHGQGMSLSYLILGMIGSSIGFTKCAVLSGNGLLVPSNNNLVFAYGEMK
jgi:hypothetical protein